MTKENKPNPVTREPECPICGKVECMTGLPDTTPAPEPPIGSFSTGYLRYQDEVLKKPCGQIPVAPESYKPAEGPDFGLCKCGKPKNDAIHVKTAAEAFVLGDSFMAQGWPPDRRHIFDPAATPVTVEAPLLNKDSFLSPLTQAACAISQLSNDSYRKKQIVSIAEAERIIKGYGLATPKPIGDVEAVARLIHVHVSEVANSCEELTITHCESAAKAVIAALSPFFAPAPPCSECATPSMEEINLPWTVSGDSPSNPPMVWDASGDSIVNQMEDGTPYFEPEVAAFIGKAANSLAAHETECATLRKERDDARAWSNKWESLSKGQDITITVLSKALSAAEAQLSTLRDALENKLNRALSDAKDLNGYATNDDGGLGMRLLKVAGHTTGMIIRLERELKEIVAPTPEVATKE